MPRTLDDLDIRILGEMQKDASQTMRELADRVTSTPATCHRRWQRLKASGYVEKTVSLLSSASFPDACTAVIGVSLVDQKRSSQQEVREFIAARDEIIMAWMTVGEFDFILLGKFSDQADYSQFLKNELQSVSAISQYRTYLSVDELKFQPARQLSKHLSEKS